MTTKELLEKAKAVGGWYIQRQGRIRTKNKLDCCGYDACPIVAVFGGDNNKPVSVGAAGGLRRNSAFNLAISADVPVTDAIEFRVRAELRKEMESWCK